MVLAEVALPHSRVLHDVALEIVVAGAIVVLRFDHHAGGVKAIAVDIGLFGGRRRDRQAGQGPIGGRIKGLGQKQLRFTVACHSIITCGRGCREVVAAGCRQLDFDGVSGAGGKAAGNWGFAVKPLDISSQTGRGHGHAGVRCSALSRSIQVSDGHAGDGGLENGNRRLCTGHDRHQILFVISVLFNPFAHRRRCIQVKIIVPRRCVGVYRKGCDELHLRAAVNGIRAACAHIGTRNGTVRRIACACRRSVVARGGKAFYGEYILVVSILHTDGICLLRPAHGRECYRHSKFIAGPHACGHVCLHGHIAPCRIHGRHQGQDQAERENKGENSFFH